MSSGRILSNAYGTRYVELSTQFDSDPYWHASITQTIAAITENGVVLHRLKSDETSVRFELSRDEIDVLVDQYRAHLAACEEDSTQVRNRLDDPPVPPSG